LRTTDAKPLSRDGSESRSPLALFGADQEWADEWLHEKGLPPRKKSRRRKGKPKSR